VEPLSFDVTGNTEHFNKAIDQALEKVYQFKREVEKPSKEGLIDQKIIDDQIFALNELKKEYETLREKRAQALTTEEYNEYNEKVREVAANIKSVGSELESLQSQMSLQKLGTEIEVTNELYEQQKGIIAELEKSYKDLIEQTKKIGDETLKAKTAELRKEIDSEREALEKMKSILDSTKSSYKSLTAERRTIIDAMTQLKLHGEEESEVYKDLQLRLVEVTKAIKSVRSETQSLSDVRGAFQGIIQGLGALSGSLGAVQGVTSLLSTSNENLQRSMLKVQSLMSVSIGLQSVYQATLKEGAFQTQIISRVTTVYDTIIKRLSASLKISAASAKAMTAALTLGLSIAITEGLLLLDKYLTKQKEIKKEAQEFSKAVASHMTEGALLIERVNRGAISQTDGIKQANELIRQYGFEVRDATQFENAFIQNKDKIILAMRDMAKAQVLARKEAELYQQILEGAEGSELTYWQRTFKFLLDGISGFSQAAGFKAAEIAAVGTDNFRKALQERFKETGEEADKAIQRLKETLESLFDPIKPEIKIEQDQSYEYLVSHINKVKKEYENLYDYLDYLEAQKLKFPGGKEAEFLSEQIEETVKQIRINTRNLYEQVVKDTATYSEKRLKIEQDFAKAVKDINREALTETEYNRLLEGLKTIRKQELEDLEWTAVESTKAFRELTSQMGSLTRKEARDLTDELLRQAETLGVSKDILEEIKGILKEIENSVKLDTYNQVAGALRQMSGTLKEINEELADAVSAVGNMLEITVRIASGDVLGGILQALATGIEAATKVIKDHQKVAQEFEKAVSERYRNYMQGLIDGVAKALDTTSDLLDSVGRKLLIGFRLTFNVLGRELNNMIAQFRKTLEIIDPNLSIDLRNIFRVSYDMDDIKLIIDTNKKAIHEIEQLLLSPDLTDDQRELLEKMLEGYLALIDKAEQTQKRFQELLTGTTAQAISDSIAQGFAQGKRSIEDFADDFESLMRKAMLSVFQLRYLDEEIEKFYNSFADVMDEGLTADKMLELQQLWNKIIEGGIEGLDYLERITGMSLFPEVEETADQLAGAVKGITQESASIIAGQLNALRIGNAQVVTTVVEQLSVLRRIEINTKDISNIYNELKKPNNERVYV